MLNEKKTKAAGPKKPLISKVKNRPKGEFVCAFRNGVGTWRIQLIAMGSGPDTRKAYFRFQLWSHPEDGGLPIKDGPGCGFTLSVKEAATLVKELTAALRRIETGEFNIHDPKNALVTRSKGIV